MNFQFPIREITRYLIALFFIYYASCFMLHLSHAHAQEAPNNKFGVHFAQPHSPDLIKAAEMLNADGGDWGYVTLVIQEDDRNRQKWQEVFDLLREYHLVPIIRIATHPDGAKWKRPSKKEAQGWADFLDSLNWVVKNRYIVLFNEPNHGSEWGGAVDAYDFAETTKEFAEKLKAKNPDFFVMLGAVDSSAPHNPPYFEDEYYFLEKVINNITIEQFNNLFSGLASHSYPNPAFAGSPWDSGRGTIKGYEWELGLLGRLGVNKKLPVFITETGWSAGRLSRETIASYLQYAYQNVWLPDERVVAVTPFVFDYQGEPFLNFSWKLYQAEEFYPQYYTIRSLSKTKGDPEQIDIGEFLVDLPKELVTNSNYHFRVKLRNKGQAMWDKNFGYQLSVISNQRENPFEYVASDIKNVRPFEETEIDLYIKTNEMVGKKSGKVVLTKESKTILGINDWSFEIVPLPSLKFSIQLFPKLITNGEHFETQIFDEKQELVFKKGGIKIVRGTGVISDVQNVIPKRRYRIVLLNPYYLPIQGFLTVQRGENTIRFKKMFPLDFDKNGHLDWGDISKLIRNPALIRLLFP